MAKKIERTWKQKDGKSIPISQMEDSHLANALKMMARTWAEAHLSKVTSSILFKDLSNEAKRRGFQITFLAKPITHNGRLEYVDVFIPTPRSRLAAGFFPTDWDSRPQE